MSCWMSICAPVLGACAPRWGPEIIENDVPERGNEGKDRVSDRVGIPVTPSFEQQGDGTNQISYFLSLLELLGWVVTGVFSLLQLHLLICAPSQLSPKARRWLKVLCFLNLMGPHVWAHPAVSPEPKVSPRIPCIQLYPFFTSCMLLVPISLANQAGSRAFVAGVMDFSCEKPLRIVESERY